MENQENRVNENNEIENLEEVNLPTCEYCGEILDEDDGYETPDGIMCEDCFNDAYTICEDCGEPLRNDDVVTVNGRYGGIYVCQDCAGNHYSYCLDCNEYYVHNRMWTDDICCNCSDRYIRCEDCGDTVLEEDARYDDAGNGYCCRCYDRQIRNVIQPYSYKPAPKFGFRSAAQNRYQTALLTYGVELEVDKGDDVDEAAAEVQDVTDMVYIKHDGSLTEGQGFEIVSHPGTLDYHCYTMQWKLMMKRCAEHGFKSHDAGTCGLHIHVGREQLAGNDEDRKRIAGRIVMLVNRHWSKCVTFSRRSDGQLDWAKKTDLGWLNAEEMTARDLEYNAYGEARGDRYRAVNVQNSETLEFRIFRGTLKRDTLIAAMQLCDNICRFAMTHDGLECWNSTWEDVSRYAVHKELMAYLDSKGI